MNMMLFEKHQQTPLSESLVLFKENHDKALDLINLLTNEALFTKKYYLWTGSTSLASYAISATSSHYDWALKILKKYQKSLKNMSN